MLLTTQPIMCIYFEHTIQYHGDTLFFRVHYLTTGFASNYVELCLYILAQNQH